ncbi:RRP15-like protein isoform X2 [Panulirus ornatus]|uniref:RRP15-like protein isoform X2 n=1 Tax=Panulirus ornatus TaxID=150431 RepID=UPI003A87E81A
MCNRGYATMAISNGNPLNKPRVTEDESNLEDSGSEVEFGNDKEAELGGDCKMEAEDGNDVEDIKEMEEEDNILNQISEEKCNAVKAKDIAQEDIASGNKKEGECAVNYSACDDFKIKSKLASDQAVVSVKSTIRSTRVVEDTSSESEMDSEDANDSVDDDESDKMKDKKVGNRGLANVMAKILATKKSENVILSKAKKDKTFIKEAEDISDDSFEVVDGSGKVKKEPKTKEEKDNKLVTQSLIKKELEKKIWGRRFRVKPSIKKDWEKERRLRVLATQGVVQLFTAIEKHKDMVKKRISETQSVVEREKILETTGREAFLEVLRQQGKKVKVSQEEEAVKEEIKDEPVEIPAKEKPRWNVLADNFYKEPTLKSWDQQSDDED